MKLITLNIWGGKVFYPLMDFLKEKAQEVDVFCFQEVFESSALTFTRGEDYDLHDRKVKITQEHHSRANIFSEICQALPEFQGIFHSAQDNTDVFGKIDDDLHYGLATFIRKSIKVRSSDEIFVHGSKNGFDGSDYSTLPRNLQYTQLAWKNSLTTIANFHGHWNGRGKTDTPERIRQSEKVNDFLHSVDGPKVLCGDFNLLPNTESLKLLEGDMRNLVKEFHVVSTRSSMYEKPEKFADYILISPEIKLSQFKVLDVEVSDHLPLYIEFE